MTHEQVTVAPYEPAQTDPLMRRVQRILKGTASFEDRFFSNPQDAAQILRKFREMGAVVAFVSGVWDFFHIGHSTYLRRGKEETSLLYPHAEHVILAVGIDTDQLTRDRKGPTRPIVPEIERWKLLAEVRSVDIIVPQSKTDELFAVLPHDVRIISESTKDLPGIEKMRTRCAHIVNLPPQAETSTTERYRRLVLEGQMKTLDALRDKLSPHLDRLSQLVPTLEQLGAILDEVRNEIR